MNSLHEKILESAEMSRADHALMEMALERHAPRKILEVGVAAGGTTAMLLDKMPRSSRLCSVDISTIYWKDAAKPVGFLAEELFGNDPRWRRFYGLDISSCIDQIGGDIDFAVLDTTHALPGELLSFMCILPFMSERSHIFIHDTGLHTRDKIFANTKSRAYACALLFNAIYSADKTMSDDGIPNSGLVEICRDHVIKNIYPVIDMLFMDWAYIPSKSILKLTAKYVAKFYSDANARLFQKAVLYNLEHNEKKAAGKNIFVSIA
jgi:hypothetical protein